MVAKPISLKHFDQIDDDDEDDFILPRRTAAPRTPVEPAVELTTGTTANEQKTDESKKPSTRKVPGARKKASNSPGPTNTPKPEAPVVSKAATAPQANPGVIRSTSIHLPYETHQRLLAERDSTGNSNGTIIKMALEQTHARLRELIGARPTTTGTLFTPVPAKAPRATRTSKGPLVALNARFYEADLAVIDELVETHGAFSRGHLITTALDAYLPSGE